MGITDPAKPEQQADTATNTTKNNETATNNNDENNSKKEAAIDHDVVAQEDKVAKVAKDGIDDAEIVEDDDDWKIQRDESKQLGDSAFRAGNFDKAILYYTAALSLDPEFVVALSNRSACYMKTNQKSKALHDARACVQLVLEAGADGDGAFSGTTATTASSLFPLSKAYSRLAAALQGLGRWKDAATNWSFVLKQDPDNAAARQGSLACQEQQKEEEKEKQEELEQQEQQQHEEAYSSLDNNKEDGGGGDVGGGANGGQEEEDDLDDFFNEVEGAASEVVKQKQELIAQQELELEQQQQPTNRILHHKKDLGTAQEQMDRILQDNYKWLNLNPFWVLDISHTATKEEISRRYKALSLLLHPDKNATKNNNNDSSLDNDRVQEAYDQVLKAKTQLEDENKASHCRQLIEQGRKLGKAEWEKQQQQLRRVSLEEAQIKAVQKIFAQIEHNRREVEQRERNHEQREREKEEEEAAKGRNERKFDKSWKQEERVEKRIGNWRNFQQNKKKPK